MYHFLLVVALCTPIAVIFLLRRLLKRPRFVHPEIRLDYKVAIVTGAEGGVGKAIAEDLAYRGAHVIMACYEMEAGLKTAQEIMLKTCNSHVYVEHLDLASFESIVKFAQSAPPQVHLLFNNTSVKALTKMLCTKEGIEYVFGVNHVGHFLLTHLLADRLKAASPSRVVVITCFLQNFAQLDVEEMCTGANYSRYRTFMRSKLANVMFAHELASRLPSGVTAYSCNTSLQTRQKWRHLGPFLGIFYDFLSWLVVAQKGAATPLYCAMQPELAAESGLYYSGCTHMKPHSLAYEVDACFKLWKKTVHLIYEKAPPGVLPPGWDKLPA